MSKTTNTYTIATAVVCVVFPILVGALSSYLTSNAMMSFVQMKKPPLAPPSFLFPVVWTLLYIMMGLSSYFIITSDSSRKYVGILLYLGQLFFNFVWSLIFFRLESYIIAAIWLFILIIMIVALIVNTSHYSKAAMYLLLPYILWCSFALYLNLGIAVLN